MLGASQAGVKRIMTGTLNRREGALERNVKTGTSQGTRAAPASELLKRLQLQESQSGLLSKISHEFKHAMSSGTHKAKQILPRPTATAQSQNPTESHLQALGADSKSLLMENLVHNFHSHTKEARDALDAILLDQQFQQPKNYECSSDPLLRTFLIKNKGSYQHKGLIDSQMSAETSEQMS